MTSSGEFPHSDKIPFVNLCIQYEDCAQQQPQQQQTPTQHSSHMFAQPQPFSPTLTQFQHPDRYNVSPQKPQPSQRIPTPPQSETVSYPQVIPAYSRPSLENQDAEVKATGTLLTTVKEAIRCRACNNIFNRAFICHDYLIQLNRPIQCVCGCVLCTLCYQDQNGCRVHSIVSTRGPVNATANNLACLPDLKHLGNWDLQINTGDSFKTAANLCVQQMMMGAQRPELKDLQNGMCII